MKHYFHLFSFFFLQYFPSVYSSLHVFLLHLVASSSAHSSHCPCASCRLLWVAPYPSFSGTIPLTLELFPPMFSPSSAECPLLPLLLLPPVLYNLWLHKSPFLLLYPPNSLSYQLCSPASKNILFYPRLSSLSPTCDLPGPAPLSKGDNKGLTLCHLPFTSWTAALRLLLAWDNPPYTLKTF